MKYSIFTILFFIVLQFSVFANESMLDKEFQKIKSSEEAINEKISALKSFYKKYTKYSKREEIAYTLASLYILNDNYKEAINILKTLYEKTKKTEYTKMSSIMLASLYTKEKKYNEAIDVYNKILKTEKSGNYYNEALYGRANCYFEMKSYLEAIGNYKRLSFINDFKYISSVLYNLALCYENTKNVKEAIEIYSTIIKKYSSSYEAQLAQSKTTLAKIESESDRKKIETKSKTKTFLKPTIYESSIINTYQMGRFREKERADALIKIIYSLGYKAYIKEEKIDNSISYVVRIDIPNDTRNIEELKKRLAFENIAFFKVNWKCVKLLHF